VLVPCNFVTYCNPCSCCQVFGEHIDTALADNSIGHLYVWTCIIGTRRLKKGHKKPLGTNDTGDVNI